jgi:hypothetical protein
MVIEVSKFTGVKDLLFDKLKKVKISDSISFLENEVTL